MTHSEESINYLEDHIPELAESAVTQAYWQTLASGNSVLERQDGIIYEVFPDGTRKAIKTVEAPSLASIGQKMIVP